MGILYMRRIDVTGGLGWSGGNAAALYAACTDSHPGILRMLCDNCIKVGHAKGQTNEGCCSKLDDNSGKKTK